MNDQPSVRWPNGGRKEGYQDAYEGDGVKIYPNPARENSGGTVQSQTTNALNTYNSCGVGVVSRLNGELRIRYITEREALRLMGQNDTAIDRVFAAERSKTIRYKLAGNSIVVNVLMAIFQGIYIDRTFRAVKVLEDFA